MTFSICAVKSESGTMSLADLKDISVECFSWVCLLQFTQSVRRIFAACRNAWYFSSSLWSASSRLSFSRASPRGTADAHMKPEPQVWSRIETRSQLQFQCSRSVLICRFDTKLPQNFSVPVTQWFHKESSTFPVPLWCSVFKPFFFCRRIVQSMKDLVLSSIHGFYKLWNCWWINTVQVYRRVFLTYKTLFVVRGFVFTALLTWLMLQCHSNVCHTFLRLACNLATGLDYYFWQANTTVIIK